MKNLFTYKPLLSRIIKETVIECRNMSYEEIESCIEDSIQVDKVLLEPGLTNSEEKILGLNTEMYINEEGLIKFDIFTYLRIPDKNQETIIKIYLNLEFMNDDKPGYDISLRALFYCCRMISMQEGVEFTLHTDDSEKYGNIKKVYSIWVCTEAAQKRANSIEKYEINRSFLFGENDDSTRYDIINAVIINISKRHDTAGTDNELIKMLTVLFDEGLSGPEKVRILNDTHKIPMTREIGKEVPEVCTYAEAMVLKGLEQGIEQEKRRSEWKDAEIQRLKKELEIARKNANKNSLDN